MDLYVDGARVRVDPAQLLGKGGEAEIFPFGAGLVLKVFKTPDHPDLQGQKAEQDAARARLDEHQRKLPAFPAGLPDEVVRPLKLATDKRGRNVLGYAMRRVDNAEPLMRLSDPVFRRAYSGNSVVEVFSRLHETVSQLHARGVVIGDFNDLNVLVRGSAIDVIDSDSFQFGGFLSHVFTERFLDPLLMAGQPVLSRPYVPAADWFAFTALLMQSLLLVGPWGGIHKPKNVGAKVSPAQRPLQRLSVFAPDVLYPRPARPLGSLPDDLLAVFQRVVEDDDRSVFPRHLLASLRFSRCASCGLEHAFSACPTCRPHAAATAPVVVTSRGTVVARTLFATEGVVVLAQIRRGQLRCVAHDSEAYRDQDGNEVLRGALRPSIRFVAGPQLWSVTSGAATPVSPDREASGAAGAPSSSGRLPTPQGRAIPPTGAALSPPGVRSTLSGASSPAGRQARETNSLPSTGAVPSPAGSPSTASGSASRSLSADAFAANDRHVFWTCSGSLFRDGLLGPERIGAVIEGQTRLGVGERFGAGLYRAGNFSMLFTFDSDRGGLRESPNALRVSGELIDVRFTFSESHGWICVTTRERGQLHRQLTVVDPSGAVLGRSDLAAEPEWLTSLQADPVAVGPLLFVPTDRGVVRVEVRSGVPMVTREFPDTEPFVDSATPLLFDGRGLIAVQTQRVLKLEMQ